MEVTSGTSDVDCCGDRRGFGVYCLSARAGGRDLVCCHDRDPGAR